MFEPSHSPATPLHFRLPTIMSQTLLFEALFVLFHSRSSLYPPHHCWTIKSIRPRHTACCAACAWITYGRHFHMAAHCSIWLVGHILTDASKCICIGSWPQRRGQAHWSNICRYMGKYAEHSIRWSFTVIVWTLDVCIVYAANRLIEKVLYWRYTQKYSEVRIFSITVDLAT